MQTDREMDIIIYGATGYTGRLVTEYIHKKYSDDSFRWAIAGRNKQKLESLKVELQLSQSIPIIIADSDNLDAITNMVQKTKVILTTAGPYQLYGENLLAACALEGTDYVDLCGEPLWMHDMIDKYDNFAKSSGARIIFSCGFDSIPFDYGVWYIQQRSMKKFGSIASNIKGRVRSLKGVFSGGSVTSFKATQATTYTNNHLSSLLNNPFALTNGFIGPDQPKTQKARFDEALKVWLAPFPLATVNSKNIHRTNKLLNHYYGTNFTYDEMTIVGPGPEAEKIAKNMSENDLLLKSYQTPGEGPSQNERENGSYDLLFLGETENGQITKVSVKDNLDPGYGSSSKMITETAICLLRNPELASLGIQTPVSALEATLFMRLQEYADIQILEEI